MTDNIDVSERIEELVWQFKKEAPDSDFQFWYDYPERRTIIEFHADGAETRLPHRIALDDIAIRTVGLDKLLLEADRQIRNLLGIRRENK